MLQIDLLESNLLPFFFAIFMWALLLGIDMFKIPLPEGISWGIDLLGPPPLLINVIVLILEHVMQRLDNIENKIATIELIENLDKKIHNQITQDSTRIDKLKDIITNLVSAFS